MKRLLGFILGAGLGVATGIILRKVFNKSNQPEAISPTVSETTPSPSTSTTTSEETTFERPTAKFTVRRTGPRPQSPIEEAVDHIKETDAYNPAPEIATPPAQESVSPEAAEPATETLSLAEEKTETKNDSFLPIRDLGEVSNRKLHEAGITTYATLATTPVEKLAEITGFPVSRIEKAGWTKQAKQLANGLPIETDFSEPVETTEATEKES